MIDITNIEYNLSSFITSLSLLTGFEFTVDSFKPKTKTKAYCVETVTVGDDGDQGRSINMLNINIKVRDEFEYLAKEAALAVYQTKEFFGFDRVLPAFTEGAFMVTEKKTSSIKAVNAPSFFMTDDDGRYVYLMSVEIKISSS